VNMVLQHQSLYSMPTVAIAALYEQSTTYDPSGLKQTLVIPSKWKLPDVIASDVGSAISSCYCKGSALNFLSLSRLASARARYGAWSWWYRCK
jgi:hypothetical protein